MSYLDQIFRSVMLTKLFTKGWGSPHDLKRIFDFRKIMSNRETCQYLVDAHYPIFIDKEETQKQVKIIEGHFISPLVKHLPGIMPLEVQTARFQMILPKNWQHPGSLWGNALKPVVIHLGGTGDHGFGRRRKMLARPLLKQAGIASIILENPYYGCRKPKKQLRSCLQNVSDLFVMGGALVLESLALLHWCEKQGYGPLGMTGISMGGHMASLAASNWPKPLSLIPCLSWSTASMVFTQGVMSGAVDWKLLQKQFSKEKVYEDELSKMISSPEQNKENHAFQLGVEFAKNFPESLEDFTLHQEKYTNIHHNELENKDNGKYFQSKNKHYEGKQSSNAENSKLYHTSAALLFATEKGENSLSSHSSKNFLEKLRLSRDDNVINQHTLDFMRGVMDECTHLGNFSVPVDPTLIIIVTAKDDAYIPRDTVMSLKDMWPGAKVRYVNTGHVAAFLTKQGEFRKAIIDSFDCQVKKYYN